MAHHAIVVLAPEDTPEGRGRILHALHTAQHLSKAGERVEIYFDGIGVTVPDAFLERSNRFTENYGPLFDSLKPSFAGACDFCARVRFEATEGTAAYEMPLLGGEGKHHSLAGLLQQGATVTTF